MARSSSPFSPVPSPPKWYEDRALVVIFAVAAIQASFVGVELAVALITDSLSLLSDGLHNLGDVASLGLGGGALIFSKRAASATMTFGWRRAELVGGLINGVLIVGMQSVIALQALDRLFEPSEVEANLAFFITTTLSLVVNIVGAFMLSAAGVAHSHSHGGDDHGHSHGGGGGHGHGEKKKEGGHGHSHGGEKKEKKEGGGHGHSHEMKGKESGGHGHSHGGGGSDASPAAAAEGGHGHSHGGEKKEKKEKKEGGGHGHSHGDGAAAASEGGHGHSHGGEKKEKKEGGGHGHSHGGDKKEKSGHGHAHGSEKTSLLATGEEPKKQLNENFRIMIIHLIGDGIGCIVVLITGLIIRFTTWKWKVYADAIGSLLISAIIFYASWDVIRESAHVLLQRVPPGVKVDEMRKRVRAVAGVIGVHEIHVWQLVDAAVVGSCHVKCRDGDDFTRIANEVKSITHNYGMHSFTIQPEFLPHDKGCDAKDSRGDCICKEDEDSTDSELCALSCAPDCQETEDLCCSPAPGSPAPRRAESPSAYGSF